MSCRIKFRVEGDPEARYVSVSMHREEFWDPDIVVARLFMYLIKLGYTERELRLVKVVDFWYES